MDTFSAVARDSGVASLQSMAPGVSSALVTTVVGLLVAIPAMFGYNFIVNRIRVMTIRLDNYASELQSVLTKRFLGDGSLSIVRPRADEGSYAVGGEEESRADEEAPQRGKDRTYDDDPIHSHAPSPEPEDVGEPKV